MKITKFWSLPNLAEQVHRLYQQKTVAVEENNTNRETKKIFNDFCALLNL